MDTEDINKENYNPDDVIEADMWYGYKNLIGAVH